MQKLRDRQKLEMETKKFGIGSLEDPLNKEEYPEARNVANGKRMQIGNVVRVVEKIQVS